MHSFGNTSMLMVRRNNSFFTAIKQRMEKDIDEVGKIARQAKTKVDELEKDVCSCLTLIVISICLCYYMSFCKIFCSETLLNSL